MEKKRLPAESATLPVPEEQQADSTPAPAAERDPDRALPRAAAGPAERDAGESEARSQESVWWYEVTGNYTRIRYRIWKRTGEWGPKQCFSVSDTTRFGALRAFAREMNVKNLPFEVLSLERRNIYRQCFGDWLREMEWD